MRLPFFSRNSSTRGNAFCFSDAGTQTASHFLFLGSRHRDPEPVVEEAVKPRFLDTPPSIVIKDLSSNESESRQLVIAGTASHLIETLTTINEDLNFVQDFFMSYRSFTDSKVKRVFARWLSEFPSFSAYSWPLQCSLLPYERDLVFFRFWVVMLTQTGCALVSARHLRLCPALARAHCPSFVCLDRARHF